MAVAVFIEHVTVNDPDSNTPVSVSIYKDLDSGKMFGVDTSYISTHFRNSDRDEVPRPIGGGKVELVGEWIPISPDLADNVSSTN